MEAKKGDINEHLQESNVKEGVKEQTKKETNEEGQHKEITEAKKEGGHHIAQKDASKDASNSSHVPAASTATSLDTHAATEHNSQVIVSHDDEKPSTATTTTSTTATAIASTQTFEAAKETHADSQGTANDVSIETSCSKGEKTVVDVTVSNVDRKEIPVSPRTETEVVKPVAAAQIVEIKVAQSVEAKAAETKPKETVVAAVVKEATTGETKQPSQVDEKHAHAFGMT